MFLFVWLSAWKEQREKQTEEPFRPWMLTWSKLLNWSNAAHRKYVWNSRKAFQLISVIFPQLTDGWIKSRLFRSSSLKRSHRPAPPSAARFLSPETAAAWETTLPSATWSALNAAQATFWRGPAPLNVWRSPTLWPSGTAPYPAASVGRRVKHVHLC